MPKTALFFADMTDSLVCVFLVSPVAFVSLVRYGVPFGTLARARARPLGHGCWHTLTAVSKCKPMAAERSSTLVTKRIENTLQVAVSVQIVPVITVSKTA